MGSEDRLCHVNLLKRYVNRSPAPVVACMVMSQVPEEGGGDYHETVGFRLRNLEALQALDSYLSHISAEWQSAIKMLLVEFSPLFKDVPGQTTLTVHDVDVGGSSPIKQHPYRLPPSKLHVLKEELSYILEIGATERGQS